MQVDAGSGYAAGVRAGAGGRASERARAGERMRAEARRTVPAPVHTSFNAIVRQYQRMDSMHYATYALRSATLHGVWCRFRLRVGTAAVNAIRPAATLNFTPGHATVGHYLPMACIVVPWRTDFSPGPGGLDINKSDAPVTDISHEMTWALRHTRRGRVRV